MRYITASLHHRILTLLLLLSVITLAALGIIRLPITVDIQDYFLHDDPAIVNQKKVDSLFGRNEFIAVLFESSNVFSQHSLEVIHEIGELLEREVPYGGKPIHIGRVSSFRDNGKKLSFDSTGNCLNTKDEILSYTQALQTTPTMRNNLFSEDGKEAWILLPLKYPPAEKDTITQFEIGAIADKALRGVSLSSSMRITPTGTAVFAARKKAEMLQDLIKILVVGAILTLLLTTIILKTPQAVLGTLSIIVLAIVVTFGISGWLNIAADSAFIAVPILLTTGVSIGYTVHITHFFNRYYSKGHSRQLSVVYALKHTWWPILFTVITTVLALLSFLFIQITPIQWVGGISAACILAVYGLALFVYPIILSFGEDKKGVIDTHYEEHGFEGFYHKLYNLINKNRIFIAIAFLIFTISMIVALLKTEVDFSAEKMMGLRLPHMKDQAHIGASQIGSNEFMDLTIEGNSAYFKDPKVIQALAKVQADIEKLPLVKNTFSVVDILQEAHTSQTKKENTPLPSDKKALSKLYNILTLFSKGTLRKWTTEDFNKGRVFIQMSDFSSKTIEDNLQKIDQIVKTHLEESTYILSGSTYQMALMNQHITRGLLTSIASALAMITVLMILIFRNVKLGLIAMIPNILPLLFCGGLMGLMNIPLEFVTMTVAPLILGLSVDDTIHFVAGMKENILKTKEYHTGIEATLAIIGTAITKTTIILCTVFLAFLVSDVTSMKNMGILAFSGIFMAYLADILLTPIVIAWVKPFKLDSCE